MNRWRFIDSGPGTGAENMAEDEMLLKEAADGHALPTLRLYTWDPAAVSLGRFQDIDASVNRDACKRRGIDIVRRTTGGRAVLHSLELTYGIISRTDNPVFPNSVLGTYKVIAEALLAGLEELGIRAEMVSRSGRHAGMVKTRSKDPSCFSSASWYEILVNNRKIIGSAQRRIAGAFLQHGSVLIGHDPDLESEVITGAGQGDRVTCIRREAGRNVSYEEVKQAFLRGFSKKFQTGF